MPDHNPEPPSDSIADAARRIAAVGPVPSPELAERLRDLIADGKERTGDDA